MLKMRLVGISSNAIYVQTKTATHDWEQVTMNFMDFDTWMADNFPKDYAVYIRRREPEQYAAEFFYNYKETENMRRKGIAHVFSK